MGTLRDAILSADDLPREQVDTPEWAPFGAPSIYVRGLSGKEREAWERRMTDRRTGEPNLKVQDVRASFVVLVACDEQGQPLFTEDDIEALSSKSALALIRLWNVGRRLSGLMTQDELETETNPSKGDQEELSSSGSPTPSE